MTSNSDSKSLPENWNEDIAEPDLELVIVYLSYVLGDLAKLDVECWRLLVRIIERLNGRIVAPL